MFEKYILNGDEIILTDHKGNITVLKNTINIENTLELMNCIEFFQNRFNNLNCKKNRYELERKDAIIYTSIPTAAIAFAALYNHILDGGIDNPSFYIFSMFIMLANCSYHVYKDTKKLKKVKALLDKLNNVIINYEEELSQYNPPQTINSIITSIDMSFLEEYKDDDKVLKLNLSELKKKKI